MSGAPGNLFRVRLLLAAKDRGGDEESHSKTSRLRGLSGCRSARLLIGEDAEPGSESDRVIHKHYVPEDSLLANIDQMSTVHLFDGKSACFSKRTELMDLLKCTKQTSTSLQVRKVKRCCQLIRQQHYAVMRSKNGVRCTAGRIAGAGTTWIETAFVRIGATGLGMSIEGTGGSGVGAGNCRIFAIAGYL